MMTFKTDTEMLHYVASNDYDIKKDMVSVVDGVVYAIGNKVYERDQLVAIIDKQNQKVLRLDPTYAKSYRSFYIIRQAFDHYPITDLPCLNVEIMKAYCTNVFTLLKKKKKIGLSLQRKAITFYQSLQFMGQLPAEMMKKFNDVYTAVSTAILDKDRKRAETQQRKIDETNRQYAEFRTYLDLLFRDKLKNINPFSNEARIICMQEGIRATDAEIDAFIKKKESLPLVTRSDVYVSGNLLKPLYRSILGDAFNIRHILRYAYDDSKAPDLLYYDKDTKAFITSQRIKVDDKSGLVMKLLKKLAKDMRAGKDCSKYTGKHVGPFDIVEVNSGAQFVRVGCHCFILENLEYIVNNMRDL